MADYSPSELTVVLASHTQKMAWRHHAWSHWFAKRGSPEEDFHKTQDFQESQGKHVLGGNLDYWVLVPRADSESTDILSACRALKRQIKSLEKETGEIKDGVSYCITSVITPAAHRRKGYAKIFLSMLHYQLATPGSLPSWPADVWGAPPPPGRHDALYSSLWSDVGDTFYRMCKIGRGVGERDGWVALQDEELVWDFGDAEGSSEGESIQLVKDWQVDLPKDLVDAHEVKLLKKRAERSSGKVFVLDSAASPGIINYYLIRLQNIHPDHVRPTLSYGFITDSSWAIWCPTFDDDEPPTLRLMSVGGIDEEGLDGLLKVVVGQARRMGCRRITAWGLETGLEDGWLKRGAVVRKKEDHLGAMAWYGKEQPEEVCWVGGEEYTWA